MKIIASFLLAATLLYIACSRNDHGVGDDIKAARESQFFHQYLSSNTLVMALAGKMQRENAARPFVQHLISQIGFPRWDRSLVINKKGVLPSGRGASDDTASIVYIPFVQNQAVAVNALLLFKVTATDTSYQYVMDWQYDEFGFDSTGQGWNARDVFHLFSSFDRQVFGRTEFRITDDRLFGPALPGQTTIVKLKPQPAGQQRSDILIAFQVCSVYDVCTGPAEGDWCNGGCTTGCLYYTHSETQCTAYWIDDGWTAGGGTGTGGTGGGSTGGGGGYPPPQCGSVTLRTEVDPNCGPGWYPPTGPTSGSLINQNIIDSLQGFPCAQDVLAQMPGCNAATDSILSRVFAKNDKVNVIFIADSTLPAGINGKTEFDKVSFQANGTINFRIRLQTNLIKNASKECIAKVMIHETVHAYIDYYWLQYVNHIIDSNQFKIRFPKVWEYKNKNNSQHIQMAMSYLSAIKSFVQSYSPGISDSVNTAMAWNGLGKTQPWINLGTDTTRMLELYYISKYGTKAQMVPFGLHKCMGL